MTRISRVPTLVLALVLAIVCAGCAGSSAAATPGVLKVAWPSNPSSLDPQRGNAGSDHGVLFTLYDTLISFTPETLEPAPGLAESWDQSDPNVLVLHLRHGVTFHDGTPFDAEAVKYNIERAQGEKSNIQADVQAIASVDVVDEYTVRLDLAEPDSSLLLTLADRAGMMISPTAAEEHGDAFERNPVGAGPWQFVEWQNGARVRVERFPGYWQEGLPHLDGINFTIMTDDSTAVNALRSGQQDFAFDPPPQDIGNLEESPGFGASVSPQLYQKIVYLDVSAAPFDDVRVRKALNLAINRQQLLEVAHFGRGEVGWTPLPSAHWAYAEQLVPTYPYDPEQARRLLAEAGHPDGVSFPMIVYSDPTSIRLGEVLAYQLSKVGIRVDLIPTELTQGTSEFFNERRYPAMLSAWTGRPDPALTYKLMFTAEGYYNTGHVATPGIDEALAAANTTPDLAERKAGLARLAEIVADNALFVPLFFPASAAIYSDDVSGYEPSLLGKPKFTTVRIER
ncbi:ABC transporter substrate-binding protein [Pseudonocardia nigra]|uniref:ABC transporter substrate-binding protein n=1 Tax=Pseudonocardia nigra TaxID=1921578 RepID=UPI001C5DF7BC|nr:ABC transporter substrate-binding protein [Pseudonocardia nigra]